MASPIPFDLHSPCPKCTGKGMDFRYCVSDHAGQQRIEDFGSHPEHLDLTCQWCGYVRFMLTADARAIAVQERNVTT